VVEALRAAKLAALRRGAPPGEWAAFTVVGDGFVTVPLRAPTSRARWWAAAALAAVAAPGGVAVAMRRRLAPRLWPASSRWR